MLTKLVSLPATCTVDFCSSNLKFFAFPEPRTDLQDPEKLNQVGEDSKGALLAAATLGSKAKGSKSTWGGGR